MFCRSEGLLSGVIRFVPHFVPLDFTKGGRYKSNSAATVAQSFPKMSKIEEPVKKRSSLISSSMFAFFKRYAIKKGNSFSDASQSDKLNKLGEDIVTAQQPNSVVSNDVGTYLAKVSGLNNQQLLDLIDNVYVPNKTYNFPKVYKRTIIYEPNS